MTDISPPLAPLPLEGVRVIDAATFIAAPYCASILGEFGAEVIKVEHPEGGDPFRKFGTPSDRADSSLAWLSEGRNKKSVTLDLRAEEGAEIFRDLVARSDVLCENFRPGTLEKWGLGWDVLQAMNPKLVMLRISGYGQTGPYKDRPGFARIAHGMGGLAHLAGMPDGPPVTPGSTSLADYTSGLYGAVGVLLALRSAEATGVGQVIDIGLYESIFRVLDEMAPAFAKTGLVRERMGPAAPNVCPHSHYPTRDGKWVAIACTNDKMFERLAGAMGTPELADRFGPAAARLGAREEVDGIVEAWTRSLDRDGILAICEDHGVPCGPLHAIDEIFDDPQFAARENLVTVADAEAGETVVPGVMPKLSATPGRIDALGPALGAHTDEVLESILGLDAAALANLRAKGVI